MTGYDGTHNKLGFCWVCWAAAGVDPRLLSDNSPGVPVVVEGAGVDPNSPELGAVDVAGAGVAPNRPEPGVEVIVAPGVVPPKIPPVAGALVAAGVVPNIPPVAGAEVVVVAAGVVPPKIPLAVPAAGPVGAVPKLPLLGWVDVLGVPKRLLVFGVLPALPRLKRLLPEVVPVPGCWVGVPLRIC